MPKEELSWLSDGSSLIEYEKRNPKKRDSKCFHRYESYKKARTVGEALQAGAQKADLMNDFKKGYLRQPLSRDAPVKASSSLTAWCNHSKEEITDDLEVMDSPGGCAGGSSSSSGLANSLRRGSSSSSSRVSQPGGGLLGMSCQERETTLWKRLQSRGCAPRDIQAPLPPSEPSQPSRLGPRVEVLRPAASPQRQAAAPVDPALLEYRSVLESVTDVAHGIVERCGGGLEEEETDVAHGIVERCGGGLGEEETDVARGIVERCGGGLEEEEEDLPPTQPDDEDIGHQEPSEPPAQGGSAAEPPEPLRQQPDEEKLREPEELDEDGEDGERILLTCRFGVVLVKEEPCEDDSSGPPGVAQPVASEATANEQADGGPAEGGAEASGQDNEDPEAKKRREEQEALKQFEAAQIESYESNVKERQRREANDLVLLNEGIEPLLQRDQELTFALCSCDVLESVENRKLLLRYLKLQEKAIRWYKPPATAQEYFDKQRELLQAMLEQPDAAQAVATFLEKETAHVDWEMSRMLEKGRSVPEIFAPSVSVSQEGLMVELD